MKKVILAILLMASTLGIKAQEEVFNPADTTLSIVGYFSRKYLLIEKDSTSAQNTYYLKFLANNNWYPKLDSTHNDGTPSQFVWLDKLGIMKASPSSEIILNKYQSGLGNVENTALSTWVGSSNITTVGTLTNCVYHATPIANGYISSAPYWNGKQDAIGYTPYNATNPSGYISTETDPTFNTKFATKSTTDLTEGSNKYYTDTRARSAITFTTNTTNTYTYNSSTGLLNVPKIKRIETYSGTTDGSGSYTVVFANAYSVPPYVNPTIPNQSATNQYLRVSNVTVNGFTINAYAFNTNNLLGIISLLTTTSNITSMAIDVSVIEK